MPRSGEGPVICSADTGVSTTKLRPVWLRPSHLGFILLSVSVRFPEWQDIVKMTTSRAGRARMLSANADHFAKNVPRGPPWLCEYMTNVSLVVRVRAYRARRSLTRRALN